MSFSAALRAVGRAGARSAFVEAGMRARALGPVVAALRRGDIAAAEALQAPLAGLQYCNAFLHHCYRASLC